VALALGLLLVSSPAMSQVPFGENVTGWSIGLGISF
jgi:hypothetical protein